MIGFLVPYALVFVAGFVVGVLVGRKHSAQVEQAVAVAEQVKKDVGQTKA